MRSHPQTAEPQQLRRAVETTEIRSRIAKWKMWNARRERATGVRLRLFILQFDLIALLALLAMPAGGASAADGPPRDPQTERCNSMLAAQLAKPYPSGGCWHYEDQALAAYWLNRQTAAGDQALLTERDQELAASLKDNDFHWHAYILERIYFLFGRQSRHFPGRMSAEAEAALVDMLWQWAGPRCRLEMTLPERDWWQWGSENHHAQAWSGFWGAAQIFAAHSDYKDRRYADGTTPEKMSAAFDDYFKRFARNRATRGLLVECNSGYNKYTLGGWYNMADFAADAELRRRMSRLLDVFWADWAIEQLGGVRGGSRHRCYPGDDSTSGSSMQGIAWYHFGLGPAKSQHPSAMCAATTFWRPSPLLAELVRDVEGRGVYEFTSRRLGLLPPETKAETRLNFVSDAKHPFYEPHGVYQLRPAGGSLLRYSYCTPDFVLGTSMVEARPREDWAAISSQNRWEGVIFAGHPTARIFAQPLQPPRGSVYNAQWSVQKRGVLVVQRLKTSNAKGQRIWFDASLARVERDGWVFAAAGRAYAAVRAVTGGTAWEADTLEQHRSKKGATDLGQWLKCQDEFTPVIIEVVRQADCPGFEEFQTSVVGNPLRWENHRLDYTSRLNRTTLTLFADYSRSPLVDGQPIDYSPGRVYDSPLLQADYGGDTVMLRKGQQQEVWMFAE